MVKDKHGWCFGLVNTKDGLIVSEIYFDDINKKVYAWSPINFNTKRITDPLDSKMIVKDLSDAITKGIVFQVDENWHIKKKQQRGKFY